MMTGRWSGRRARPVLSGPFGPRSPVYSAPLARPGIGVLHLLGVLCGIRREGGIIEKAATGADVPVAVRCSGAVPEIAARCAAELVAAGATRLLSFGVAGGLADGLKSGDLVLPSRVLDPDGNAWSADAAWLAALRRDFPDAADGTLLGVDAAVTDAARKSELRAGSGAAAVDMESHHLARVASEAGLPFLCVRAVADDSGAALPRAAMAAVGPDGSERPLRVALALLKRPGDLPDLLRLARASGSAFRTLGRVGSAGACLGVGLP